MHRVGGCFVCIARQIVPDEKTAGFYKSPSSGKEKATMEKKMKKIILFPLAFVLAFSLCVKAEREGTSDSSYTTAPEFVLTDLSGNEISLSDFKGKVVFLNFWATWCSPCRAEIPGFVEAYSQYKEKGMEIIGVSVDRGGTNKVLEFVRTYRINYPVAMYTMKIIRDYELGRAIPTTIIIDRKGRIRRKHIGYMDKGTLERYFLDLAEEK